VTVWGRAGGWVGTAQVMHLSLPKLHLLEAWCARPREGGRRDAGLVGASLSADVPLACSIEHTFCWCQVPFRMRLGFPSLARSSDWVTHQERVVDTVGIGLRTITGHRSLRYDRRGYPSVLSVLRTTVCPTPQVTPAVHLRSGAALHGFRRCDRSRPAPETHDHGKPRRWRPDRPSARLRAARWREDRGGWSARPE
jgi:hypothetical protein